MHPGPSFLDMKMQCSCASKPHPGVATHAEAVSTLCAVACSGPGGKDSEKHGELRLFVGEGLDGTLRHPEAARLADALERAALGNLIASIEELQVRWPRKPPA